MLERTRGTLAAEASVQTWTEAEQRGEIPAAIARLHEEVGQLEEAVELAAKTFDSVVVPGDLVPDDEAIAADTDVGRAIANATTRVHLAARRLRVLAQRAQL